MKIKVKKTLSVEQIKEKQKSEIEQKKKMLEKEELFKVEKLEEIDLGPTLEDADIDLLIQNRNISNQNGGKKENVKEEKNK